MRQAKFRSVCRRCSRKKKTPPSRQSTTALFRHLLLMSLLAQPAAGSVMSKTPQSTQGARWDHLPRYTRHRRHWWALIGLLPSAHVTWLPRTGISFWSASCTSYHKLLTSRRHATRSCRIWYPLTWILKGRTSNSSSRPWTSTFARLHYSR